MNQLCFALSHMTCCERCECWPLRADTVIYDAIKLDKQQAKNVRKQKCCSTVNHLSTSRLLRFSELWTCLRPSASPGFSSFFHCSRMRFWTQAHWSTLVTNKSKRVAARVWSAAIFPSAFEERENMSEELMPTLKLHAIIQWMGHSLIPVSHWKNADFNLIMCIFHHILLLLYKLNCCIYWNLVKGHLIGKFLNDSLF